MANISKIAKLIDDEAIKFIVVIKAIAVIRVIRAIMGITAYMAITKVIAMTTIIQSKFQKIQRKTLYFDILCH